MREIREYTLTMQPEQEIEIPRGFRILSVQLVRGLPKLFVLVDPRQIDLEPVTLWSFGTGIGVNVPQERLLQPVGYYQQAEGLIVTHVFREVGGARQASGLKPERWTPRVAPRRAMDQT